MSNYTYMVTNKINGKVYVGSHCWKGEGIDPNYYGSGTAITRAVKKYGKENFQVEVLYYYNTIEECRQDEERILTEYNVRDCPHSYNLKNSAMGGDKGRKLSDETRKKMSQASKGENNPMYGKRGKDSPWYGKHLSEEHKQKIAQASKGRQHTEETRKKLSRAHKGKTLSDETRKKMSQASKGKKHTEETRKKLSQSKKNIMTPVVVIDKNGKVKMFESQRECARQLNLEQSHISNCLKGKIKHTGGYFFKHLKRCSKDYKITKRKAKETEKIILPTKIKVKTPLVAIDKGTGKIRMFLSQAECSRVLGIHNENINSCLNGRRKSAGGYTFKKINRDRRIFTVSPRSKADINVLQKVLQNNL